MRIHYAKNSQTVEQLNGQSSGALRTATLRLLVIPFGVYAAWVLEIFLLAGTVSVFIRFNPTGIFLYTIIACIITGLIAPLVCLRTAFLSGAVNMFQIGFRSLRRTLLTGFLTCVGIYGAIMVFNPFGTDRLAFANAFILLLPTAIASVMMCWALMGTHVQAFVRSGGALISLSVGISATTVLYFVATLSSVPTSLDQSFFLCAVALGIIAAFFFFAARDIYATSLFVGAGSVFCMADRIDPLYLQNIGQVVWTSSVLAVCTLIVIHWYLSRNFVTVKIPVK
jgi:hypothetical protein